MKASIFIQSEAAECYYRKMRITPLKAFPEDLAAKAGLAVTGGIAPGQPIE